MAVCLCVFPSSICAQFARICVCVYYRSWSGALVVWRCIHWSWTARAFFPSWVRWPQATEPAANMLHAVSVPPSFFECLCLCVCRFIYMCICVCVCVYAYIWVRLPQASEPALNMLHAPLSLCVSMCLFPRFCVCWWFCVCRGICVCICACVFVYLRGFADRWSAKNMLHARSLNTARCFAFPFPRHIFPNIPQPEIEDLPEPPEPLSPELTDPNASTAWLSKSLN